MAATCTARTGEAELSRSGARRLRLRGRLPEQPEFALKILDTGEVLVDAGEAHVRDLVDGAQGFEHRKTDLARCHLWPAKPHLVLDMIRDALDLLERERAALGGGDDAGSDTTTIERLPLSGPLDDDEGNFFDPLVGRKALAAAHT